MRFDLGRLRRGEQVAAIGALVLLIALFFLDWYGASISNGVDRIEFGGMSGWEAHEALRWLMLLTIAGAALLVVTTATAETPAVPASVAPVVAAVAALTTLLLAYRVLINEPGPNDVMTVKLGAYVGLAAAAVVTYGCYLSMREEGGPPLGDVPARRVGEGAGPPAA